MRSTASAAGLAVAMDAPPRAAVVSTAVGVVALLTYCVGLHLLIVLGDMPMMVVALVLAPWAIAGGGALMRVATRVSPRLGRFVGLALAVALAAASFLLATTLVRDGHVGQSGVETVVYVENVAFFGALSSTFWLSLASKREALVTRMARLLRHGDMPDALVRYTRGATLAWALFFAAHVAVSSVLFFGASRAIWSLFVNVATWPCVAAMFVGEYAVRLALLRGIRHDSLWAGVTAFRDTRGRR